MFGFGETGLLRPRWLSDERIAFIGCLVAAALFLWQAVDLEMWTVVGPGPGLFPAITAGNQPPLGVTDTTQPWSSAASMLVVPRRNVRSNSACAA